MYWNVSYLLGVIALQTMLIWYTRSNRSLPTKDNKMFIGVLWSILCMSWINVACVVLDGSTTSKLSSLLSVITSVYYLSYMVTIWMSFCLIMVLCRYTKFLVKYKYLLVIPCVLMSVLVISPYSYVIFDYDGSWMFERGYLYPLINSGLLIYFLLGLVLASKKSTLVVRERFCMWVCIALFVTGALLHEQFPQHILLEPFLSGAAIILFITMQNPEFYIAKNIGCFNEEAFLKYVDEFNSSTTSLNCVGVNIKNIENCRNFYGALSVDRGLRNVYEWLQNCYEDSYIFFVDNRSFILISSEDINMNVFKNKVDNRFVSAFVHDDIEIYFTASPFVVSDTNKCTKPEELLAAVSLMGHRKVTRCSDGVYYIDSKVYEYITYEKQVNTAISRAIDNKSFEVYLQPIVEASTGKTKGAEALCRLFDDDIGFVSPGVFIPVSESSGAILKVGLIVFEKVCEYISTHNLNEMGISFINVNISPVQCQDINLVNKYYQIANKYNVDFSLFDFEITETFEDESLLFESLMTGFVDKGAKVSLDDFGKGNSSISRLHKCPVQVAKLDIDIVWDYFDGKNDVMVHVINMFKADGLKIIAEGIETDHMVNVLSSIGCDYLQGFHYSKPMSFDDFDEYILDELGVKDLSLITK